MAETTSYTQHKERLEEIVLQVRAKDMPLEKSLDLYDEALAIGARCVERLEQTDFTSEELESVAGHPEVDISGAVQSDIGDADQSDISDAAQSDISGAV